VTSRSRWVSCLVAAAALASLGACASAGGDAPGGDDDIGGDPVDAALLPDSPSSFIDAASGTPDAGPGPTADAATGAGCSSGATCAGATSLGTVSGDTANQKLTASGYQSAWYRVRVTEDDDTLGGLTLRVAAKLTSPASADYDVFVYLNEDSDVVECSTTTGTTTTTGLTNEVKAEWGEVGIANGLADDRDVSIEVRPISGTCSPGQTWQLQVEGNWN
jgi:hypothetical protein